MDRDPLGETISRRVSQILHVPQIAVLLRASSAYQLQQAVGLDARMRITFSRTLGESRKDLIHRKRISALLRHEPSQATRHFHIQANREQ